MHTLVRGSVGLRSCILQGQGAMDFYPLKPHNDEASHWEGPSTASGLVLRFS
jgi:hypothetical protein